jgi:branched-chain amino acid transport system substrate-binding protein
VFTFGLIVHSVCSAKIAGHGEFRLEESKVRKNIATSLVALGAVSALALSTIGPAMASDTTGVTRNQIVIGTTTSLTGPASPGYEFVAPAAKAYFDYVNRNGGINGRQVKYIYLDDKYNPAEAKKLTSQLILRDKIFAMFGSLGTPPHSAVIADLNRRGIPDVFVNTGFSGFNNARKYPTTFMILPSYKMEAKIMASYIEATPDLKSKTRCLFYQEGDFGLDAEAGFKAAGMTFAATRSYFSGQQAAGFGAQMTAFRQAGCDLVVFFGITNATASLLSTGRTLGYNPTYMVTQVGSDPTVFASLNVPPALLNGLYTLSPLVALGETNNPFVRQMKVIAERGNVPWNFYSYYGVNTAYVLAQALKAAGPNLTRTGFMNALETQAKSFRSAGSAPFVQSKTNRTGYTGAWIGQYNASGVLERKTSFVYTADNSDTSKAKRVNFRPAGPTPKLLP